MDRVLGWGLSFLIVWWRCWCQAVEGCGQIWDVLSRKMGVISSGDDQRHACQLSSRQHFSIRVLFEGRFWGSRRWCETWLVQPYKTTSSAHIIRRSILLTMSIYVSFTVSYDTYWVRSHSYIVSCNCDIAFVHTHCVKRVKNVTMHIKNFCDPLNIFNFCIVTQNIFGIAKQ